MFKFLKDMFNDPGDDRIVSDPFMENEDAQYIAPKNVVSKVHVPEVEEDDGFQGMEWAALGVYQEDGTHHLLDHTKHDLP